MSATADRLIDDAAREGRRIHSAWDSARFDEACRGPARMLWDRLSERPQPSDEATFAAYLTLLRELVGAGYLQTAGESDEGRRASFLEIVLLELVPWALAVESADTRTALLASAWNIGEGLRRAPAWLDRYVVGHAREVEAVSEVEAFVTRTLEPVLEPSVPAAWSGPFRVQVLDMRPAHDTFLPGEMHLAAPSVLCVQDRRNARTRLNVLLRHEGESRILGLSGPLDAYDDERRIPDIIFSDSTLRIGEQRVDVPLLGPPFHMAACGAGFVVASALDSQRLWIVESA